MVRFHHIPVVAGPGQAGPLCLGIEPVSKTRLLTRRREHALGRDAREKSHWPSLRLKPRTFQVADLIM